MYLNLHIVTCPFEPFCQSIDVQYNYRDVLVVFVVVVVVVIYSTGIVVVGLVVSVCPLWMLCVQLNLLCRMFRAHGGKLQACKAFLMCPNSL